MLISKNGSVQVLLNIIHCSFTAVRPNTGLCRYHILAEAVEHNTRGANFLFHDADGITALLYGNMDMAKHPTC